MWMKNLKLNSFEEFGNQRRFGEIWKTSSGTGELKTGSKAIRRKEETEATGNSSLLPVQPLRAKIKGNTRRRVGLNSVSKF